MNALPLQSRCRILFVDNDDRLLDALRDPVWKMRRAWETLFVSSGEAALAELHRRHFDVVIANLRLPDMDGAAFFAHVRDECPLVTRIIIAGPAESASSLSTAHHVLVKPVQADELTSLIAQACANPAAENSRVIECNVRTPAADKVCEANRIRQTQCRAALSRCNDAIIHSTTEAELFRQVCQIAVELGGMKMAWVGIVDPASNRVRPVASFSDDTGYLKDIEISVDAASPSGRGATGVALRTGLPVWCQDFQNDLAQRPWRERGMSAGWASSASLPLRRNGAGVGVFTLYSGEVAAFDEPTRDLLVEVVSNIGFALDNFDRESQRGRIEKELRRESDRNQIFLRNASDGVHILDVEGKVLEVSDSFCTMLGYSRDELIGAHISLWDREWSPRQMQELLAAQLASTRKTFETKHRRRDGSLFDVEVTGQSLELNGQPVLFNSSRDITGRRRSEATLRLQSAALNAAANPIVITSRNGTIEWVNSAFTACSGYSAEEAIGKNPRDLVKSGAHEQKFYKQIWDTILAGKVWHGEMTNRRKDGSIYAEEQTITPVIDEDGACTHFIAIKRDLSEEKRQQARFLQAQKMESVGRLAGGVAHDFNNLLTVILSYSEVALDDLKDGDPLRESIAEIRKAGRRAAALTSQLLMFSRQQVLEPRVVDLNDVLTDMERMLKRVLGEDIELVSVPMRPLGRVKIDRTSFEQVIMNLAVNARDAMPTGGQLTIETGEVVLDDEFARLHVGAKPGPHVMLAVTDTGIGMDHTTQARIFEPFFTTKEIGKGTGLGLSTVFGIVQQSGGTVWVYSELGKGTTFKVYLPRVGSVVTPEEAPLPPTVGCGSETILLVEDEEAVRVVARAILQRLGYRVIEARSGDDAILHSHGHVGAIDLLLTDVVMPRMSGPVLAMRLAETRPGMKVICMSGYTDDSIVRHGVLDSKIAFLQKPLTPDKLRRKVREVLDAPAQH